MQIEKLGDACTGCGACSNICSRDCISMRPDNEGFLRPVIDHDRCASCGECDRKCPGIQRASLPEIGRIADEPVYLGYSSDKTVHESSSSGGIFYELAVWVLEYHKGVVYGAAFDEKMHVRHVRADSLNELQTIQGSKYVQSEIGNIYRSVRDDLLLGKKVLFSGCGCQVSGLKSFLGKEYEGLFCVALVCHGVPSPGVWDDYISHFRNVKSVNFRDITRGDWKNYSFSITTRTRKSYWKETENPYTYAFVSDAIVRRSCFKCKFKGARCDADIMIGDAWGIDKFCRKMLDKTGTSLMIAFTDKGKSMLEGIRDRIKLSEYEGIDPYLYNPRTIRSTRVSKNRGSFERLNRTLPQYLCIKLLLLRRKIWGSK